MGGELARRFNERSFIIISLFIIAIGMMGFYIYRYFLFNADDLSGQVASANLITNNSSFDQGISQGWITSQSTVMSSSADHATSTSTASLKVSSVYVIYSQPITVNRQDYYELSTYMKGNAGGEQVYFGWQELDVANNPIKVPASDDTMVDNTNWFSGATTLTKNWTQYKAVAKVHDAATVKVKIIFKNNTANSVTSWDDFSLISFNAKDLGCQNTNVSKCIKFSDLKSSSNATELTDGQGNIVSQAKNLSASKTDGSVSYREIAAKNSIEVKIPATSSFNSDNSDMIVEVHYKDIFNYNLYKTPSLTYGTTIANLSPWFSDAGSYPTYGFASLGLYGTQAWQTDQTLFLNSKDSPKALKPVNGFYQFKIALPTIPNLKPGDSDPTFPIDFISVTKVDSAQSKAFIEFQKRTRSMKQAYQIDNNPVPAVNASGFTWFNSPSMELVLPYSKPSTQDSIKKTIAAFSAVGETEPINFSIYTKNNLKNLQFSLGTFSSNGNNIAPANLSIKKVFYEERQWIDSKKGNTYGLLPDRLEDYTGADMAANSAQQFYLMVNLPKDQPGGTYIGVIDIKVNGVKTDSIPVSIEVLPIALDSSNHINAVSRNPYSDSTALSSKYADLVMQNMISHDMDSVMGTVGKIVLTNSASPFNFNIDYFNKTLKTSLEKGANQKIAMFQGFSGAANTIIAKLQDNPSFTKSTALYEQLSDPLFIKAMSELILQLKQSVDDYNTQNKTDIVLALESTDEPNNVLNLRIYEDRIDQIVQKAGVKTFTTFQPSANQNLTCSDSKLCGTYLNQTIPSLAPLIDYKIYHISDTGAKDSSGKIQGTDGFYTTYFSQLRNPVYDRFLSGLYADKMGTKIIYNWVYFDNGGGDPYNDFDISANRSFPAMAYDFVLAYPTWDGKINSSTSLEAMREGVKDSKYLATLQNLINKNPTDPTAVEAQKYLQDLLSKIKSDWTNDYVNQKNDYGFGQQIIKTLTGDNSSSYSTFDSIRKKMFDYIKTLSAKSVVERSVNIQANLQGRTNFTSLGVSIKVLDSQKQLVYEKNDLKMDNTGRSQITTDKLTIGSTYDFQIKVPNYLSVTQSNVVLGSAINLNFGNLLAGDLNSDNTINVADFAVMSDKWDTSDHIADINQDGTVNVADFAILAENWSKTGN